MTTRRLPGTINLYGWIVVIFMVQMATCLLYTSEKDKISAKVEHGVLFIDIPKVVDKKVQGNHQNY